MADWEMQSPLQKEAVVPTSYVETDYPRITSNRDTNTIPHHSAVETAEDGERVGRHSFPQRASLA